MMCIEKCYEILEIDESATDEQIKKAYRLKSKEFHPDSMNSDSSEMFESMTQARDLIFEYRKQKDESRKLAHDSLQEARRKKGENLFCDMDDKKRRRQMNLIRKRIEECIIRISKLQLTGAKIYKGDEYLGEIVDQKCFHDNKKKTLRVCLKTDNDNKLRWCSMMSVILEYSVVTTQDSDLTNMIEELRGLYRQLKSNNR